ncbi:MAG: ribosome biogenesis GTPase Der [Elusimicrobiota bacterium]
MIKTIAIVGRVNVGKSTLFNALLRKNIAPTSPNPGLTRDRTYSYFVPDNKSTYLLIDTGGIMLETKAGIENKVNFQVEVALQEADLILFVVDVITGLTPVDKQIADKLRKTQKPVLLVVNKADSPGKDIQSSEFYSLGFNNMVVASGEHKRNIDEISSKIKTIIPGSSKEKSQNDFLKLCITGRPNVGKSTLLNQLMGQNRVIVDSNPGTTRNPAKGYLKTPNYEWEITDLAGLWRKKRGKPIEDIVSMITARREIKRADACILMLDLTKELSLQDKRIAGWIVEGGNAVVLAGNKSDRIIYEEGLEEAFERSLIDQMPFIDFAPFIMISAKEGRGIITIFEKLEKIMVNYKKEISQENLDTLIRRCVNKRPPPEAANMRPEIKGLYQVDKNPPLFKIIVRHHRIDKIPDHWINYIKNSIRSEFDFYGVPVRVVIGRNVR